MTAYFNLAIAYYAQRNIRAAAENLERVLGFDPADGEARYNLACLRLYQGDVEEAKLQFEKAVFCCFSHSIFGRKSREALELIHQFSLLDVSTQELLLFVTQYGLPPLAVS